MKSTALGLSVACLLLLAAGCSSEQPDEQNVNSVSQRLEPSDLKDILGDITLPEGTVVWASAVDAEPDIRTIPADEALVQEPPDEALAQDLALTAETRGWTMQEAEIHHAAAEAVGRVAKKLAEQRPDIFVGSKLPNDPLAPPILYVKGPADESVFKLVAEEDVKIQIRDQQPYSIHELAERQRLVQEALLENGYWDFGIPIGIDGGGELEVTMSTTMGRKPGLSYNREDILQLLPEALRSSVKLVIEDERLIGPPDAWAIGGMEVFGDGGCTSSWGLGLKRYWSFAA